MALDQKDLELIERVVYKNGDDLAISIARSLERLEGRIDAAESRLYSRMAELDDRIEGCRQEFADELVEICDTVREIAHPREEVPTSLD